MPARVTAAILPLLIMAIPAHAILIEARPLAGDPIPVALYGVLLLASVSFLSLGIGLNHRLGPRGFVGWMALTSVIVQVAVAAQADRLIRGSPASSRQAAALISRWDPSGTAPVFACGLRNHGLEFYLQRLVFRSRSASDIVLPVDGELEGRVGRDDEAQIAALSRGPAFVLVKESRRISEPVFQEWRLIGRVGPLALLASRPVAARPPAALSEGVP